jgi:hypothetical protein
LSQKNLNLHSITRIEKAVLKTLKFIQSIYLKIIKKLESNTFLDAIIFNKYLEKNVLAEIQSFCFYSCFQLESISLPHSVTDIDPFIFSDCLELESENLSNKIKLLKKWLFSEYAKLKEFWFQNQLRMHLNVAHTSAWVCIIIITIFSLNQVHVLQLIILRSKHNFFQLFKWIFCYV